MQHNHLTITYAYHFLSEAIIIFLIALPFFHHRFFFVPYGSYFIIIVLTCIIFSLLTRYTTKYFWYTLMTPLLFGTFVILDYPMIFAVLFSLLFVWRYIDIRKEEFIKRQNIYILLTLILTAAISILVNDSRIMLYPFLQFVILFLGYIVSQLVIVQEEDRKKVDFKLPLYFVGLLVLGAGISFLLFEIARNTALAISQGFLNAIGGVIRGFSSMLSFLTVEQRGWPKQTNDDDAKHGDGYWNQLQEFNVVEGVSFFLVIAIALLILSVATFYVIVLFKKPNKQKSEENITNGAVTYSDLTNASSSEMESRNLFQSLFNKPRDPIRKLVYQFEKKAAKKKKGRASFETIEEWMKRIGAPVKIEIYQQVRYGDKQVSNDEVKSLKQLLKDLEAKLEL